MSYAYFRDVPLGATFGQYGEWVKQSTRTARYIAADRVFYFRQADLVTYRRIIEALPK